MSVSKVYRDINQYLETIHDQVEEGYSEAPETAEVNKFLSLEKGLAQNSLTLDASTRKEILRHIGALKNSPALETMLGTLQSRFFQFLATIEKRLNNDDEKNKINGVQFDRLD